LNWLDNYAKYTKDHFSPALFHLWVGISCISAVLERKVWTTLVRDKIYPNQYVILVAPPGLCGKGAAMSLGKELLQEVDNLNIGPDMVTREKLIKIMTEVQDTYPDKITGRPIIHSSLTMICDELESFMTAKNDDLVVFLTKIWSAEHLKKVEYKTKHVGEDIIIGPWLNMLGATIPAFFSLPIMQKVIGGGFSARTIFLYSEWPRPKRIGKEVSQAMDKWVEPLVEGLQEIHLLTGEFTFTDEAWAWFQPWVENAPQELIVDAAMAVFKIRETPHLMKIAMVLSASQGGNGMKITLDNCKMALYYLEAVEKWMRMLFTGTGRAETNEDCKTMLTYIDRIDGPVGMDQLKQDLAWDIALDNFYGTIHILLNAKEIKQVHTEDGHLWYERIRDKKE